MAGIHLFGAIMTALYEREHTGVARVVEVAMQDAIYSSLASNLGMLHARGAEAPARTGNRHGGLGVSPYNVYTTSRRLCRAQRAGRQPFPRDPRHHGPVPT